METSRLCVSGYIGPATAPWIARNKTSIVRLVARPQHNEASENSAVAQTNVFTSPKRRERNPVSGNAIALATVNDVMTQTDWFWLAPKLPAMVGSETLAMVRSSTCMKVPSDNPIVASGRLAGRNSPKDWVVVAAFEAMEAFWYQTEKPLQQSGRGRPFWHRPKAMHVNTTELRQTATLENRKPTDDVPVPPVTARQRTRPDTVGPKHGWRAQCAATGVAASPLLAWMILAINASALAVSRAYTSVLNTGCCGACCDSTGPDWSWRFTSTFIERPILNGCLSSSFWSRSMRTGRRCTILIQLPEAFCAGNSENALPVPIPRPAIWPR